MTRLALAALLAAVACRARTPMYEYEAPVTTVSGGIGTEGAEAPPPTTTTTVPARPRAWQGPARW